MMLLEVLAPAILDRWFPACVPCMALNGLVMGVLRQF